MFHTYAFWLTVGAILAQNSINKFDQSVMYASKLLNSVKKNYNNIEREALTMVYALHKFIHYFMGN
jgi:hypothetical protein